VATGPCSSRSCGLRPDRHGGRLVRLHERSLARGERVRPGSSETDDDPGENVAEDEGEGKPDKTPKASRSPKPRSREGCPAGFEGNHGRFVSESDDKQAAAHSPCGKPERKDKKDKPEKSPKPEKTPKPAKDESSDG
jgi:hypothetical protein